MKSICFLAMMASATALAEPVELSVSEDAALIKTSYAYPQAANTNFGTASEVSAGSYHHVASGLFRFDLSPIHDLLYRKAELLIRAPRIVGSSNAEFQFVQTSPDWIENEVTWNSQPEAVLDLGKQATVGEDLIVDVTAALNRSRYLGETHLSLEIQSTGAANIFIPSREAGSSVTLRVTPFEDSSADQVGN